jgi:5'(3')-deoxyribonucleotidase
MKKPFNIFIDSDGPIADFESAYVKSGLHIDEFKYLIGTYTLLNVVQESINPIQYLKKLDDQDLIKVWILTKTPSESPNAYAEKALWYKRYFPWLKDRIIFTQDKSVVGTKHDFLLDDRPHKANASKFSGTLIVFDIDKQKESWDNFVNVIKAKLKIDF